MDFRKNTEVHLFLNIAKGYYILRTRLISHCANNISHFRQEKYHWALRKSFFRNALLGTTFLR